MDLAARGHTATEIAREVGVAAKTIRKNLRDADVPLASPTPATRKSDIAVAVIKLHQNGQDLSPPQIATHLETTPATVRRILDRHGIPRGDARKTGSGGASRITPPPPEELAQLYAEQGNAANLARHLNIGHSTALRMLKACGIQTKTAAEAQKGRPGQDHGARALAREIAAAGTSASQVRAWARQRGIDVGEVGLPQRRVWEAYLARTAMAHPSTATRRSSHDM